MQYYICAIYCIQKKIYSKRIEAVIDASPYIDDRNRALWETMNKRFNISVEHSVEDCYGNYLIKDDCTIYVCKNEDPSPSSFTHELLHLYLPTKDIRIGSTIQLFLQEHYPQCLIFDKILYDHISNCLEHIKTFPIFVEMGYPTQDFIQDYITNKLTDNDLNPIVHYYRVGLFKKRYNVQAVNCFIGKFFASKADVNPDHNYDNQLLKLKALDSQLYSILDGFWNNWIDYDIECKREVWEHNHRTLVDTFDKELTQWGKNKNFQVV